MKQRHNLYICGRKNNHMILKNINGWQMEKMLRNGLACLGEKKKKINDLNVFPVPDGDTGTNMYLTLEHGLAEAQKSGRIGEFMKGVSDGALLGARGNSGVILSQILRGMAKSLEGKKTANSEAFRQAFAMGCKYAYAAVAQPVEGTILTVIREGGEGITPMDTALLPVNSFLKLYLAGMKKSLDRTPELLPVLKKAGVVDSGAMGFFVIAEGMLKYLEGDVAFDSGAPVYTPKAGKSLNESKNLFGPDSPFEDGYCMEFVLQLMNSPEYELFSREAYVSALQSMGNSIVAVQDGTRVKVHIHTKKPSGPITFSQKFGEFVDFKLENMQIQHNEKNSYREKPAEDKKTAVVAVTDSDKTKELFYALGCDAVIDGGETMNVPVEKFLDVFASVHADSVIVLPNNKNTAFAAGQAGKMYTDGNAIIVPARSIPEGYFALSLDMDGEADAKTRAEKMGQNCSDIKTLSVTAASREYSENGIACMEGDMICLSDGHLRATGKDSVDALLRGISAFEGIEDKEALVIFRGASEPEARESKVIREIHEVFPDFEISFIDGGSPLYNWCAAVF